MWNPMLIPQTLIASATATLFRFQIAMLVTLMSTWFRRIAVIWDRSEDLRPNNDQ